MKIQPFLTKARKNTKLCLNTAAFEFIEEAITKSSKIKYITIPNYEFFGDYIEKILHRACLS